jgi:hypothetical protein
MIKFKTDHLKPWRIREIEEGGYWIIPSHRDSTKSKMVTETVHYWTVTITLTSGEVEEFYIKARNKQEAIEKAEQYSYLPKLGLKGEWRLLP